MLATGMVEQFTHMAFHLPFVFKYVRTHQFAICLNFLCLYILISMQCSLMLFSFLLLHLCYCILWLSHNNGNIL